MWITPPIWPLKVPHSISPFWNYHHEHTQYVTPNSYMFPSPIKLTVKMNHLSISPSTHPLICHLTMFIPPPTHFPIFTITPLPTCLSIHPTNQPFIRPPAYIHLTTCPSICPLPHLSSTHPLTHISIHPPIYPPVHQSIHPVKVNYHDFLFKVFQIFETFTNTIFSKL